MTEHNKYDIFISYRRVGGDAQLCKVHICDAFNSPMRSNARMCMQNAVPAMNPRAR